MSIDRRGVKRLLDRAYADIRFNRWDETTVEKWFWWFGRCEESHVESAIREWEMTPPRSQSAQAYPPSTDHLRPLLEARGRYAEPKVPNVPIPGSAERENDPCLHAINCPGLCEGVGKVLGGDHDRNRPDALDACTGESVSIFAGLDRSIEQCRIICSDPRTAGFGWRGKKSRMTREQYALKLEALEAQRAKNVEIEFECVTRYNSDSAAPAEGMPSHAEFIANAQRSPSEKVDWIGRIDDLIQERGKNVPRIDKERPDTMAQARRQRQKEENALGIRRGPDGKRIDRQPPRPNEPLKLPKTETE